jgi:membrane fusion protein, heavy metal efflux system
VDGTRFLSLRAPVAGSVIKLQIAAGAVLNELSTSMMTIANLETISVSTNVSNREAELVVMGQPVEVRLPAYPGEDFKGETRLIGGAFDGDGPGTRVQIALQNPNIRLKPNMFAYVTFFGPKEVVSMVPISALVPTNTMDLVFVEVEPWIFEARAVGLRFLEDSRDVVASGLKVGERVVVKGSGLLLESQVR